jgi:hypothetical protein
MPVFLITYSTSHRDITHEIEWVCDASYDQDRARASFEQQSPSASVVSVHEVEWPAS